MTEDLFERTINNEKKAIHLENMEDLERLTVSMLKYSGDMEFGEYAGDDYSPATQITTQVGSNFSVPRSVFHVDRGSYQKEMALFYDSPSNFKTLVPLNPNKFKLVHGQSQNHFTPEMSFYMEVLYDEVCNRIGSKDNKQKLTITSGFRSIEYNKGLNDGQATWSPHSCGFAVDIAASTKTERLIILDTAFRLGFGGLGLYNTFAHVDLSGRGMWGGYTGIGGRKQ